MKVSELKETIRTKVREAVTIQQTGAPLTDPQLSQRIKTMRAKEGDPTIGTEKNPVRVVRETEAQPEEYPMSRIWKMNSAELIDFLNLPPDMARKWSDGDLLGGALEMADDRPAYEEPIDEEDYIDSDDNTIIEGVDDDNTDFKDYDSIYERMLKLVNYKG